MQSEQGVPVRFSWASALRARHVAMPAEHGAWVFLLSPLSIGLALGGLRPAGLLLIVAALSAFLVRQPVTIAVKAYSGRRSRAELPNAWFWLALYGLVGLAAAAGLITTGHGYLLALAIPALPVFAWHLWLVSRRAERRQALMEIAASGVLALAAPAGFWVGRGHYDPAGWLLWGLAWLQVAGTILYAYLRLEQRPWKRIPGVRERLVKAAAPLVYNSAAFILVLFLALVGVIPAWLPLAYLIQPVETAWGALRPAAGYKPKAIGIRQLIISTLFTLAFIITWQI